MAPEVSHPAVKVTVTARFPARSEFSENSVWPFLMSMLLTVQPDGSAAMHGSLADEGTACADKIIECPVPQTGGYAPIALAGLNALTLIQRVIIAAASTEAASTTRRVPQRCSAIGRRGGASDRNSASRSRGSRFRNVRNCVGLATPRVAANASASSSGVK